MITCTSHTAGGTQPAGDHQNEAPDAGAAPGILNCVAADAQFGHATTTTNPQPGQTPTTTARAQPGHTTVHSRITASDAGSSAPIKCGRTGSSANFRMRRITGGLGDST